MAASGGRKTSSSSKSVNKKTTKSNSKGRTSAQKRKAELERAAQDSALFHEIGLIVLFAAMVFLFCCNFGLIGPAGDMVSGVLFGLFGLMAYAVPVLLFLAAAFWFANEGNPSAMRKLVAGVVLFVMLGILCVICLGIGLHMEPIYKWGPWMDVVSIYIIPIGAALGAVSWFWIFPRKELLKEIHRGSKKAPGLWWHCLGRYVYVPCVLLLCGVALLLKVAF